ncbi:MAG: amino acid permease [Sphingomonas sp.]
MADRRARLLARKSLDDVRRDQAGHGLRRSLGPVQLTMLGIGCIVGAGVYVMSGTAAANYAGPAVILSFVIAGIACGFTALCYAELSSTLPVSGSSYTYAYTALGEVFAWGLAWLLMLEYGLAGAALAAGFAGFLASLLGDFAIHLPVAIVTPFIQSQVTPHGTVFTIGGGINLLAVAGLMLFAGVLVRGIAHSATVNVILVIIKLAVLIGFVIVGWRHVDPANWHPFIPPSRGGFTYGVPGIFRGASVLFFAYLGFETVSTAALETRNPGRDLPIGILSALVICTVLYILVARVMTGLVSYTALNVPDPVAVAVDAVGWPALSILIKLGALMGLSSVLLVNTYGQSRICFAMATDGLLPRFFAAMHPRFRTPWKGTLFVASVSALAAALLPISILGDLVSLGTAMAFSMVAVSVIWLRTTQPDLDRPFRVPLGGIRIAGVWLGVVPVLSLLFCLLTVAPVLIDIVDKAIAGQSIPLVILVCYIAVGAIFYASYGYHRSRLGGAISASAARGGAGDTGWAAPRTSDETSR